MLSKADQLVALRAQIRGLAGKYADRAYAPAPFVPVNSPRAIVQSLRLYF